MYQNTRVYGNYQDLHPQEKVVKKEYPRIKDDTNYQKDQYSHQGMQDRPRNIYPPRSTHDNQSYGNRQEYRMILKINPIMVIWMDYTKQFFKIKEDYRVNITYKRYDVEISGQRKNVQDANNFAENLLDQYEFFQLNIPFSGREKPRNLYRPFVEATHTREFGQMQQYDVRLCLLVPYKLNQLCQKLYTRFHYEGCEEEKRKLPYDYAILFCKKDKIKDFVSQINRLVETIANLLFNNITPMQAPRFNSGGLVNYRCENHKFFRQLEIHKLDAIWLAQFDKLEKISKTHKVYTQIQNSKNEEFVQMIISSYRQQFIENAYRVIRSDYLETYILSRVEFEFPQEADFQDIVTTEMKHFIETQLKSKFPNIPEDELNRHRFIDSNKMYQTAYDIDDYYQTKLADFLDLQQNGHKYLYVLGFNDQISTIIHASLRYLEENYDQQKIHQQKKQQLPQFSLEKPQQDLNQSYLQNDFDESRILDDFQVINDLTRDGENNNSNQIQPKRSEVKAIKVITRVDKQFNVQISNTEGEKFTDDRFLSQSDLSKYLRINNFNDQFQVNQSNRQLILEVQGGSEEQFIKIIEQYFNHALVFRIPYILYLYFKNNNHTQITQMCSEPFRCSFQLIQLSLSVLDDSESQIICSDQVHYKNIIKLLSEQQSITSTNQNVEYYLHFFNFPCFQKEELVQRLITLDKQLNKQCYSGTFGGLPSLNSIQKEFGNNNMLLPNILQMDQKQITKINHIENELTILFDQPLTQEDFKEIEHKIHKLRQSRDQEYSYDFADLEINDKQCEQILNHMNINDYGVSFTLTSTHLKVEGQNQSLDKFNKTYLEVLNQSKVNDQMFSSTNSSIFQMNDISQDSKQNK